MDGVAAIERCSYCREYVPVTRVSVTPASPNGIQAELTVCEECRSDGR